MISGLPSLSQNIPKPYGPVFSTGISNMNQVCINKYSFVVDLEKKLYIFSPVPDVTGNRYFSKEHTYLVHGRYSWTYSALQYSANSS